MQALDFTTKQKIAAEPMGATNIFIFYCETNALHIISLFCLGISAQAQFTRGRNPGGWIRLSLLIAV